MFDLPPEIVAILLILLGLTLAVGIQFFLRSNKGKTQSHIVNPEADLSELDSAEEDQGVLLVLAGGKIVYINQQLRSWLNLTPDSQPNIEHIAARSEPRSEFLALCAAPGKARFAGSVTMGRGSETDARFVKLSVRRFCLQLINTIYRATRWAVFESADSTLADRLRGQILTLFDCLNDLGAFVSAEFIVQCDAGIGNRADGEERFVTILLVFHPVGCDAPISLTLHQTASGFRVGSTAFGLSTRQSDR